jgi:hypothetical protein
MPVIPKFALRRLYVKGSMRADGEGVALDLKNGLAPATILRLSGLDWDGETVELERVKVKQTDGQAHPATDIAPDAPLEFPEGGNFTLIVAGISPTPGRHRAHIRAEIQDLGSLDIPVKDRMR